MQGTEKPDRELLDALGVCGGLVREGSLYRFLAENRLRLFPDVSAAMRSCPVAAM